MKKINFINPFGTTAYDDLIAETLLHYAAEDTELVISHLDACPADMDYFYPKHIVEAALLEAIMAAQEAGFDAVISGCCYDPAVLVARELVDIPVIGPMQASIQMLPNFGRTGAIVTDHAKAATWMKDNIKLYGAQELILGLDVIDWYVRDMVNDTAAVARDVIEVSERVIAKTNAEAIIVNCTIVAASYQKYLIEGGKPAPVPVLNPNLMALKMAETMADLRQKGAGDISRAGFYKQPHNAHYLQATRRTRAAWQQARPALVKAFTE